MKELTERQAKFQGQTINVASDERALFAVLAERIAAIAREAVERDGLFTMLLSGGSTPRGLYQRMATFTEDIMPWGKTYLFLGDERCVSHADSESNYKMISDNLLSRISIPSTNVFPTIRQDIDPEDSARIYEQTIRRFFKRGAEGSAGAENGAFEGEANWLKPSAENASESKTMPIFSLAIMGLGPDGHTASLFPDTAALVEEERLCVANFVPKFDAYRLTLTMPVFASCRKLFFLVQGEGKTDIVQSVLKEPERNYPAQQLIGRCPQGAVEWYMDEACTSSLI
ncbi:MAG: 6-phosphogluconolactonase [Candidatus Melainabacteria bacterium]|nr:6-phosphogluconolactonase [Candidatus Melainabacteria bacterium]